MCDFNECMGDETKQREEKSENGSRERERKKERTEERAVIGIFLLPFD